jgi:hypothetical protein
LRRLPSWWQWPTVLSLDAPAVAVLWQWMLAQTAAVPLEWHHAFILGVSVFLAYAADRWFEGWRLAPDQVRTQRHYFYQRWRWPIAFVWLLALGADVAVAIRKLNTREFEAGLMLLLPVFVYLLSHQLIHRLNRWRAPKEICVALLFAGGVSVFIMAHPNADLEAMLAPLAGFTLLCFANCALISLWEQSVDLAHGQTSLALQFRGAPALTRVLPWVLAALSLGYAVQHGGPARISAWCAAGSGVLLGTLDLAESTLGAKLARALVDFTLMTPLVAWAMAHWR